MHILTQHIINQLAHHKGIEATITHLSAGPELLFDKVNFYTPTGEFEFKTSDDILTVTRKNSSIKAGHDVLYIDVNLTQQGLVDFRYWFSSFLNANSTVGC